MSFAGIFKKASNFILGTRIGEVGVSSSYSEGEVVFCKNNVCVHPPTVLRQATDVVHHPGYLTVTCQKSTVDRPTLHLSWVPNTTLRRNPTTAANRLEQHSGRKTKDECLSLDSTLTPESQRRGSTSSYEAHCSGCYPDSGSYLDSGSASLGSDAWLSGEKSTINAGSFSDTFSVSSSDKLSAFDACAQSQDAESLTSVISVTETQNCDNAQWNHYNDGTRKTTDSCVVIDGSSSPTVTPHIYSDGFGFSTDKGANHGVCHDVSGQTATSTKNHWDGITKKVADDDSSDCFSGQTELSITNHCDGFVKKVTVCMNGGDVSSQTELAKLKHCKGYTNGVVDHTFIQSDTPSHAVSVSTVLSSAQSDGFLVASEKVKPNSSLHDEGAAVHLDFKLCKDNAASKYNTVINAVPPIIDSHNKNSCIAEECVKNVAISMGHEGSGNKYKTEELQEEGTLKANFRLHVGCDVVGLSEEPQSNGRRSQLLVGLRGCRMEEDGIAPIWMVSPELVALRHNLTFPESATASPIIRRAQRCCRKFSVDLSEMRSLRLFFSDGGKTRGQLVVASRECQYKILHFHHGGLERLAAVLEQWRLLAVKQDNSAELPPYRHFMVSRPAVKASDLHPEEGKVSMVGELAWAEMLNSEGQVEDDLALRKGIFFGGLSRSLRRTVWPFLLHCYSYQSTATERDQIQEIRRHEYNQITLRRLHLEGSARDRFVRKVQCVVEKDVVRTDRANPFYAGEDNPNIETMKEILLNYAVYDAGLGYLQGMSDLLAPVLVELGHPADTFWCFVGLMRRGLFVCTPTDSDMERNLCYLRELIHVMVPEFYSHLQRHTDAMELLFCHRWILLCFKREFPEAVALRLWEACWSNYLTDYFHLFVCLAIVAAYADDVIAQNLRTDEMLLHFSSLAMFMDGDLILRKARGLLYSFRQREVVPCSLSGLCRQCGPGMWDSAHAPTVTCTGGEACPHAHQHE